jgi:hypothetical protein
VPQSENRSPVMRVMIWVKFGPLAGVANSTGFIDPGILNTAVMTGLAPDTRYFYVYGDEVLPAHLAPLLPILCVCRGEAATRIRLAHKHVLEQGGTFVC